MKTKQIFNPYILTPLIICGFLISLPYQLRRQPMYMFKISIEDALSLNNISSRYSDKYISTIKNAYFYQPDSIHTAEFVKRVPDDSIFIIALRQIIKANNTAAGDHPSVIYDSDRNTMISHFHIKERKNFDIMITFHKMGDIYVFDEITNFPLLLSYHPENVKAFERFSSEQN